MSEVAVLRIRNVRDLINARRILRKLLIQLEFREVEISNFIASMTELYESAGIGGEAMLRISACQEKERTGVEVKIGTNQVFLPVFADMLKEEAAGSAGELGKVRSMLDVFEIKRDQEGEVYIRLVKFKS